MGKARVHASARDRLRLGSLGALIPTVLYTSFITFTHPEAASSAWIYAAAFSALAGVLHLLTRRETFSDRGVTAGGAVLLLALGGGALNGFLIVRAPSLTVFMALVVLAAGALQSDTRSLLIVVALCVTSWVIAGFTMIGATFALPAIALTIVAVIAVLIHLVVMRYVKALDTVRARDQQNHEELAAALAAAGHEITERQRAEAEREVLREQLLHSQKLEAIGTLAGGVAHDMNNVLAAIIGVAEFVRSDPHGAGADGIDQIIEAARRGAELTRNLLGFGRRGKYRKERVELAEVVTGVTALLSRTLPKGVSTRGRSRTRARGCSSRSSPPRSRAPAPVSDCRWCTAPWPTTAARSRSRPSSAPAPRSPSTCPSSSPPGRHPSLRDLPRPRPTGRHPASSWWSTRRRCSAGSTAASSSEPDIGS